LRPEEFLGLDFGNACQRDGRAGLLERPEDRELFREGLIKAGLPE
jgi:hypothetical protein